MQQPFTLPTVYQNDKFENLKQMIEILEHLEKVSTNVFETIEKKISKNKDALGNIQKRTSNCAEKVKSLVGRKTAITITSPSEYPSKNVDLFSQSLFKDVPEAPFKPRKLVRPAVKEELKVYNPIKHFENSILRIKTPYELEKEKKDPNEKEQRPQLPYGLGNIPDSLQTASNLLLFNTNEHVYKDYSATIDPLQGRDVNELPVEQRLNIDLPPNSLLKDDFMEFDVQRINFRPTLKDLPQLSLPQQLDLPDVIDISWDTNFESVKSIAPSSLLNQLPKVENPTQTNSTNTDESKVDVPPPPSMTDLPPQVSNAPPPPPPSNGPPPPPPPKTNAPPPPPPKLKEPEGASTGPKVEVSQPSDLLSSIRSFKKENLQSKDSKRTVPNRPAPKEKTKQKENVGGGNIMTALIKTMSIRRLAIDGKLDEKSKLKEESVEDIEEIKAPVLTKKNVTFQEEKDTQAPPPPPKAEEKKVVDDDWGDVDEEEY